MLERFGATDRAVPLLGDLVGFEAFVALITPGHGSATPRCRRFRPASRPFHRRRPPFPLAPLALTRSLIGVGPNSKRSRNPRSTYRR